MTQTIPSTANQYGRYEKVPPEGGWGYVVTLAVSLVFIVSIVPLSVFGLLFGPLLASLGDETNATTLLNGVFNTALFLSGLPVNQLLQRYTYRKVGVLGAVIYSIGKFSTMYTTTVLQMVITFGVIEGTGFGFMMASGFACFHDYFHLRQNVVMSICQSIIGVVGIIWPMLTHKLLDQFGFRGTVAIFAAFSLNGIVATATFQPAKWHFIKRLMIDTEMDKLTPNTEQEKIYQKGDDALVDEELVERNVLLQHSSSAVTNTASEVNGNQMEKDIDDEEEKGLWQKMSQSMDLVLFKDPLYVNLTFGTACAMTSDIMFIPVIPLLLFGYGFDHSKVTVIMTVYFAADLAGRVALSIISAIFPIWNRYVVLIGAIFATIFRVVFTLDNSYWWTICSCAVLGFLRCSIQIPFPLVFAEKYGPRFTTAFSLNMVVCGVLNFIVGILSGWVKNTFNNNIMVVHLLTGVYLLCVIPWLIEIFVLRSRKKDA